MECTTLSEIGSLFRHRSINRVNERMKGQCTAGSASSFGISAAEFNFGQVSRQNDSPAGFCGSTLIRLNRIKAQLLFESPLGSEKRSGTLLHGEVILKRMLRLGVTPRASKLRRTSKSNSKTGLSVTGLGHVPGDRGLAIKPTSDTSAAIS